MSKHYKIPDYQTLGLSNDFMFGRIMQNEKLCKPFLEQILGIKIHHIKYIEHQKTIDEKIDSRGIRMDIYVDDGRTVYNCEMQTVMNRNLPRRSRYYQSQIDVNLLAKGEDYWNLKKSFVIFICTFDPFGEDAYVYTFENMCREYSSLALQDDAVKVFLNTKGRKGIVSSELRELLEYIDSSRIPEGSSNPLIKELDDALVKARSNEEWRHDFMTLELLKRECREEGREEGLEAGRAEKTRQVVINMLKNGIDEAVIANIAEITIYDVQKIKEENGL